MAVLLVVDDDPDVRRVCVRALETEHLVMQAETAAEATERFSESQPDLVVCDIGLPDMSGLELATRLRAIRPTLRMLIISGKAAGKFGGLESDGVSFLGKPFTPAELRIAVAAILAR